MLQFWRHKCKEPEPVDLKKVKYQIETLDSVIKCIARDIKGEDSIQKKEMLIEKLRKLLSNRAWFSAIFDIEVSQRQDKLKKDNIAYCLCCDIIKEYDVSFCAVPEILCGKNPGRTNTAESIDKYKEELK